MKAYAIALPRANGVTTPAESAASGMEANAAPLIEACDSPPWCSEAPAPTRYGRKIGTLLSGNSGGQTLGERDRRN